MQDNNIIGVVRSATDTEVLQGLISLTTFRGNEEVFLIKRDGDVVLATSDVVDGSNNIYTLFDEDDESYSSIVKVINQERSMLKSTSINGQEYKIYHQGIEGIGNWGVIIAIPSYQLIELYTSTSTQEVKSRWLPNGDIEYLGRIDEQVKIRGFRIELGEIENTIRWYKGIRDVAVIAKPDRTEDMTLYAYYVCNEEIEPLEIKEYLKKTLPNYMIPNHIQKIDEIPITISGKLDKKRLPDIETVNEVNYHPPRNDIEEKLSICYSNVLGVERVGIDENFFEMGGNSIKAMKFTAKLKEYGYELSINDILNHQSIRNIYDNCFSQSKDMKNIYDLKENNLFDNVLGIQEYVQSQLQNTNNNIKKSKCIKSYQITAMQQHSLDNNILHSGLVIDYQDNLNLSQLKQAVYKLIQAESLLRSTLIKEEQTIYIKEYENLKEYYLPIIDLSKEDEGVKKEMNSLLEHRVYGNETWNKDDIFEKLLYQIIVAKYGDMDWKIYIPCCHFIFDGMSAGIIKNKLLRYYNNPNKKVEIKNSFYEYAQRLIYGPINIDSNTCVNKFELGRFNQNISKQNKIKPLELVNTTVRLSLENTIKQLEPRYAWNISYKIFMRLLYHTFGLEEISAAILVADRKSSTSSFFDTIGEFLDLLPISDFKEPEKDYKDIEILLDIMAKKHISFVEFVYNKENEGKYGDIKKIFGKIKGEKLQLPIFNYVGLYDEVKYEQFKTYEQKEFTTIVDVVCYKNELVIKGFCLKD